MSTGYRQIDHTADLALEVWAPSETELLCEGARAIVELLTEGSPVSQTARRHVAIRAVDGEDRLVQWLNEILVAAVADGFLFGSGDITLREGGLEAVVHGEADAADKVVTELKSVTYHDLELGAEAGGASWRARLVIDV